LQEKERRKKMKDKCIFCNIVYGKIKSEIIYDSALVLAFLDNDPINEGHILIIPKKHYLDLDEMPQNVINEISRVSKKVVKALKEIYKPQGYAIMQNGGNFNDIGHYHLHVFPRYDNDGFNWNFSENKFEVSNRISNKIKIEILKDEV